MSTERTMPDMPLINTAMYDIHQLLKQIAQTNTMTIRNGYNMGIEYSFRATPYPPRRTDREDTSFEILYKRTQVNIDTEAIVGSPFALPDKASENFDKLPDYIKEVIEARDDTPEKRRGIVQANAIIHARATLIDTYRSLTAMALHKIEVPIDTFKARLFLNSCFPPQHMGEYTLILKDKLATFTIETKTIEYARQPR